MKNYEYFKFNFEDSDCQESFNNLEIDRYLRNGSKYRKRAYSIGLINNNVFNWIEKKNDFIQSKDINTYVGDVRRTYPSMVGEAKEFVQTALLPSIKKFLPEHNYEVGVHQIRVSASNQTIGKVAPEGVHRDGFDYICIACVGLKNVVGGHSLLISPTNRNEIIYEVILRPGTCLFLNDKKLLHYCSPIVPKLPGSASRDVFVLTFEKKTKTTSPNFLGGA